MAIPNEPLTRAEQYLNRIATGEGTIPDEPFTRVEQYLDEIAKNGGGGGGGSGVDNVARQSIGTLSNLNTEDKSNLVAAINEVLQTVEEDTQSVLPTDTASGAIASFPDGAGDAPVKSLVATIKPVQSGSGDPSPTNIRPISGWTSETITRTGADNQSDTYTIAFPAEAGTVYGGTLDAANGVLTVNWAMVDMGSLRWDYNDTYKFFYVTSLNKKPGVLNVMSDLFRTETGSWNGTPVENALWGNETYDNVYVQHAPYVSMSANEFKNLVTGHQLLYELANPVAYQLDPVTVTTLLGVNNIWADTGDVAVDYRADTGLYIQKLTGSTEEDMIADAPIASGKYFLVGNTLYLSTAAIAAGATLTPGTNCVKTNLAEALNALNS